MAGQILVMKKLDYKDEKAKQFFFVVERGTARDEYGDIVRRLPIKPFPLVSSSSFFGRNSIIPYNLREGERTFVGP